MNDILSFILLLEQHKRKQIERTIDALTVDEVQTDEDIFQTIFASGLIFLGSLISFLILLWIVNMCFQIFTTKDFEQQENIDDLFYSKVEKPPTYNSVICRDHPGTKLIYPPANKAAHQNLCRLVKNIWRVQAPSQHSPYPLKVIQSLQYFQHKILYCNAYNIITTWWIHLRFNFERSLLYTV